MNWKAHAQVKFGQVWLLSDLNGGIFVGTRINHQHYGDVWQLATGQFLRDNDVAFYLNIPQPPVIKTLEHLLYKGEEIV